VELAGRDALYGSVGMTVDIKRAHTADTFAAVIIKYYRLLTLLHELLVEHIEHFEERTSCRHIIDMIVDETAFFFGTALTPNLQVYRNCMFHCCNIL
jgi:hypothetical protein